MIFKLPKKSDLSNCKVFHRFLLEIDRQGLAAFLKDRGCMNHNISLQCIICILNSASIVMSPCLLTKFIDFKKEFDSGFRQNLWKIRIISLNCLSRAVLADCFF